MIKLSETQILTQCLDYLKRKRYFAYRNNSGATVYETNGRRRLVRYGHAGSSDIIGMMPDGRFLAIEVKRPGGKLTELQANFLNNVNDNGGVGMVVFSLEDLIDELERAL